MVLPPESDGGDTLIHFMNWTTLTCDLTQKKSNHGYIPVRNGRSLKATSDRRGDVATGILSEVAFELRVFHD